MPFGAVPCTFTDIKDQSVGYRIFTLPLPDRICTRNGLNHINIIRMYMYPIFFPSDVNPILSACT